ncbi:putative glycolipid-binding domain-containing protein [Phytohabitans sp. LJ34]|uniref:putative glycolipid-binding domain-containing protein n=1 Tax=Phytohabitans sp. LJ34 TaxID=3452217 RepID=UPI003F89743E
MVERFVIWRGEDPERADTAAVALSGDSLSARGASTTGSYALNFVLTTGPGWVTERVRVHTAGTGWWRALDLSAREGVWAASVAGEGDGHLGPAGVADPAALRGALDCDLGLCPLTNTMPVLRHDLVAAGRRGEEVTVDFRMAWISVPDLAVHLSPQTYTSRGPAPDGGAVIDFVSGDFEAALHVDADGLVVDYPSLGRRVGAWAA